MLPVIRSLTVADLTEANALCLRSKAHWGYDAAFLEACRGELVLTPEDLGVGLAVGIEEGGAIRAVGQVSNQGGDWELEKLFVEPEAMGRGFGRLLFEWAVETVASRGGAAIAIASDPGAAAFYRKMGATDVGEEPSGSISGRFLPKLQFNVGQGS